MILCRSLPEVDGTPSCLSPDSSELQSSQSARPSRARGAAVVDWVSRTAPAQQSPVDSVDSVGLLSCVVICAVCCAVSYAVCFAVTPPPSLAHQIGPQVCVLV